MTCSGLSAEETRKIFCSVNQQWDCTLDAEPRRDSADAYTLVDNQRVREDQTPLEIYPKRQSIFLSVSFCRHSAGVFDVQDEFGRH